MNKSIGIDSGSKGALALLSPDGALLEVADMPILRDGPANRPNVNAPLLAEIIYRWQATHAFAEYVGARPGEGLWARLVSDGLEASSKAFTLLLAFP
jgi:hypothetical protein